MVLAAHRPATRFELFLIKPSHYDDDGYVIQWWRSSIPANTLATLNGLALDCASRRVLGEDVEIAVTVWDETNTRIRPDAIIAAIRAAGGHGLVGLVGVQTNQYPRAVDIARPLRAAGIPVCIGGFHVSGCLAMLPEMPPELKEAMDLGITLFAGEAEGRLDELLQAADRGALQPLYNFMNQLPGLEGTPTPFLPIEVVRKTSGTRTSFDAGRGCPFVCSFCTIINVQGRKSRSRNADDVERLVRANLAQGVRNFFITDDNLARNQHWEEIFDRLIRMREQEGLKFWIVAQVDTMAHKIKHFIEKAGRAGVNRVFIGLESINPDALKGAHKGQNQIDKYRTMLQAWHAVGTLTYAGYILGFPGDTPASIERDIGIIQRELPIDILEFFILTPLPGSADHKGVRPRARNHPAPEDGRRRTARHLPQGLGPVLLARARGDGAAPREGLGLRPAQHDVEAPVLPRPAAARERASAGRRHLPAQIPPRPAPADRAREPPGVLSAHPVGDRLQARALRGHVLALPAHAAPRPARHTPVLRPGHDAAETGRRVCPGTVLGDAGRPKGGRA